MLVSSRLELELNNGLLTAGKEYQTTQASK